MNISKCAQCSLHALFFTLIDVTGQTCDWLWSPTIAPSAIQLYAPNNAVTRHTGCWLQYNNNDNVVHGDLFLAGVCGLWRRTTYWMKTQVLFSIRVYFRIRILFAQTLRVCALLSLWDISWLPANYFCGLGWARSHPEETAIWLHHHKSSIRFAGLTVGGHSLAFSIESETNYNLYTYLKDLGISIFSIV